MKAGSQGALIEILNRRFEENMDRHAGMDWGSVRERLLKNPGKLKAIGEMEGTGGEPDVVGYDEKANAYIFYDCSHESPAGRRNLCYDREALESRKKNKPGGSAVETASAMGIELLTEGQYRNLQELGEFDTKTSSWIRTPVKIRALGGALFCDRRYGQVFLYHNGAESYYSVRGFRGQIQV